MLTEAYLYPEPHPNVRCQHMATQVNDEKREVIPMYKLIDGVAESSFGTRELLSCLVISQSRRHAERIPRFFTDVAHLAGVPDSIVTRAESVSKEFFADLQEKLARRRRSKLSSIAQAGTYER
jgi:DNA mismatch repair protein MSH6